MLKEEQAAALLLRCEVIAKKTLRTLRGNLSRANTRSAAIWEMIVFEAASKLGEVEYENSAGGPDIKIHFSKDRFAWIEVTYLHPRFDDQEQRSRAVSNWVHDEAKRIGFGGSTSCYFFGDKNNPAGPVRTLPRLDDKKLFLRNPQVSEFFAALQNPIVTELKVTLKEWTISLTADPKPSRFLHSGGSVPESPKVVGEHAAYRSLLRKRRQHDVDGPRLICIGSDTSRVLNPIQGPAEVRLEHALGAALSKSGKLSGVIIVNISDRYQIFGESQRIADATFYAISPCATPLLPQEVDTLKSLNFNRWTYTFALDRRAEAVQHHAIRSSGKLTISTQRTGTVKLVIPGSRLVDILAGRLNLIDAYGAAGSSADQMLSNILSKAWRISHCKVIEGDVEKGLSEQVEIILEPSHEQVFRRSDG